MTNLSRELQRLEAEYGGPDKMAHRLGIGRRMWDYFKAGKRRFSAKSLSRILKRFPQLHKAVSEYLKEGA